MIRPDCKHAEAFCHMNYKAQDESYQLLSIWNSRDGVTPFVINWEGVEYQHIEWGADRYDPNHLVAAGDLIFVDSQLDDLVADRLDWLVRHLDGEGFDEMLRSEYDWDGRDDTLPALVRRIAQNDLTEHGAPPPRLIKVTAEFARGWYAGKRNEERGAGGTYLNPDLLNPPKLGPGWGQR